MRCENFKISRHNYSIVLEKSEQQMSIFQSNDDDIWFSASQEETEIELNSFSRNYSEWQTYIVFECLMKSIVGRYILNGDNKKQISRLPNDFVDLENKIIIWHSDSGTDSYLRLEYTDNRSIRILISKCNNSKEHHINSVRIRTSGSEYKYYYQEFLEFFKQLLSLERRLNKRIENIQQCDEKEYIKK